MQRGYQRGQRGSGMRGFTLLELLLTMAIAVILMALSYPIYTDFQAHANRQHAAAALFQLAANLENYYLLNNSYQGANDANMHTTSLSQDLAYQLHIHSVSDTAYLIEADPIGAQASQDALCGTLFLDENNVKSISGAGNAQTCWH